MENILLFSVEINPINILSREPELSISINGQEHMTAKETEKFIQLAGESSKIVMAAMIRRLNEEYTVVNKEE